MFRVGRTVSGPAWRHACVAAVFIAVFSIVMPVVFYLSEQSLYDQHVAFTEARARVVALADDRYSPYYDGQLVQFSSDRIAAHSDLADTDFGVVAPAGTLKLARDVQYCQWHEVASTSRDSRGRTHTTYSYYKGWSSHLIFSGFFDQPFAHHNPQDAPVAATEPAFVGATLGEGYSLTPAMVTRLRDSSQAIAFEPSALRNFQQSPASNLGFRYIGDGYFYRAHTPSGFETVARLAGRFFEGSLNIQLGDLFSQCEAGDIRVRFSGSAPPMLSVLAVQGANGVLEPLTATNGQTVALVQAGRYGAEEMFRNAESDSRWGAVLVRLLMVVWSGAVLAYAGEFSLGNMVFLAGLMLGSLWMFFWGLVPSAALLFVLSAAGSAPLGKRAFARVQQWLAQRQTSAAPPASK